MAINATAAGAGAGAEAPTDTTQGAGDQTAQMKAMFAQATKENAEITGIKTEGDTAKRAASTAPG